MIKPINPKSIIFPKDYEKYIKAKIVPNKQLGWFKPKKIYHVLTNRRQPTHTYIQVLNVLPSRSPLVELIHFKVVYEDEFLNPDGSKKVFNIKK